MSHATTERREQRLSITPDSVAGGIEYRAADGNGSGRATIEGYAAVFFREGDPGTEYDLIPGLMVERIMPGAFDRALRERQDVRALFNHEPSFMLGRSASGTLRLSVDKIGLRYVIDVADTTVARDLVEHLKRGDITGSSFKFRLVRERFTRSGNKEIRELLELDLFDVGPVSYPAYKSSTAGATGGATRKQSPTDNDDRPTPRRLAPIHILQKQLDLRKRKIDLEKPTLGDRMLQLRMRRRLCALSERKQRDEDRLRCLMAPSIAVRLRQLRQRELKEIACHNRSTAAAARR